MCHHTRKHRDLEHEARKILETRLMEEEARRKRAEEERRITGHRGASSDREG